MTNPKLPAPFNAIYLPNSPHPEEPLPMVGPKVSDFPLYSQTQNPPKPRAITKSTQTLPPVLPVVPTPEVPTPVIPSQTPVPPPPGRNPAIPGSSVLPPFPAAPGAPSPFATVNNPSKWN